MRIRLKHRRMTLADGIRISVERRGTFVSSGRYAEIIDEGWIATFVFKRKSTSLKKAASLKEAMKNLRWAIAVARDPKILVVHKLLTTGAGQGKQRN